MRKNTEIRNPNDGLRSVSAWSHGIGAVLSFLGTIALFLRAGLSTLTELHWLSYMLYGASATLLYLASTLYHSVRAGLEQRMRLRKFDHSMIYVLIAGTYTPICLLAIPHMGGIIMTIVIWAIAAVGVLSSILWIHKPSWLSATLYVGMGWLAIIIIRPLMLTLPTSALIWLLAGGLLYTFGAILYALKWPGRTHPLFGFHEFFHFFVLAGSISHYIMIFVYLS